MWVFVAFNECDSGSLRKCWFQFFKYRRNADLSDRALARSVRQVFFSGLFPHACLAVELFSCFIFRKAFCFSFRRLYSMFFWLVLLVDRIPLDMKQIGAMSDARENTECSALWLCWIFSSLNCLQSFQSFPTCCQWNGRVQYDVLFGIKGTTNQNLVSMIYKS